MLQIIATVVGAVLSAISWLIRRRVRNDVVDEALERRLKLVELHQRMKSAGLNAEALGRLENELISPTASQNQAEMPGKRANSASVQTVRLM